MDNGDSVSAVLLGRQTPFDEMIFEVVFRQKKHSEEVSK